MINWTIIRPGLETLIATISKIPEKDNVVWFKQGQQFGETQISLEVGEPVTLGQRERRDSYNPTTDKLDVCYVQRFQFVLHIRIEAFSQCDEDFALAWESNIRCAFEYQSTADALQAIGVGLVRVEDTQKLKLQDDHVWSSQRLDVRLATNSVSQDEEDPGDYFDSISATGTFACGATGDIETTLDVDETP